MACLKQKRPVDCLWRRSLVLAAVVLGASTWTGDASGAGPAWIHDIDEGKQIAEAANKDLVVVFTGRGWCQPCELLDQYVFQDQAFVEATADDYVFVELDYNFGESSDEQQREKKYNRLKEAHLVPGFPTIVLMDASGLPFATIVGYARDVEPKRFAERLESARTAKGIRDERFRKAEAAATERERAEHLHEGIQSVASLFGSLEQHGDDPVLVFYRTQVDQILGSLDENNAIRASYVHRRKVRDAWHEAQIAKETHLETLNKFVSDQDYRGAIKYLDSILPVVADAAEHWRLQLRRQQYLEAAGDHGEAIRNARQLLTSTEVPAHIREAILDCEASALASSGRGEEAVAHYDRRIEAAVAEPKKMLKLLERKAWLVDGLGQTQKAIDVWKAYRDAAEPRSFEWMGGTVWLARCLKKSAAYDEALPLFDQILSTLEAAKRGEVKLIWPWSMDRGQLIMLETAECHIALGNLAEAKTLVDRAAADINALQKSPRRDDNEFAERIQEEVTPLRSKLASASTDNGD